MGNEVLSVRYERCVTLWLFYAILAMQIPVLPRIKSTTYTLGSYNWAYNTP